MYSIILLSRHSAHYLGLPPSTRATYLKHRTEVWFPATTPRLLSGTHAPHAALVRYARPPASQDLRRNLTGYNLT